jgi:hypothetical protein
LIADRRLRFFPLSDWNKAMVPSDVLELLLCVEVRTTSLAFLMGESSSVSSVATNTSLEESTCMYTVAGSAGKLVEE